MKNDTLISVIIPMYNSENTIVRALDSVRQQTAKCNFEVVIVNDGSKDNSQKIVENYIVKYNNSKFDFKLINRKNSGVSVSRNIGVENAGGNLIAFLDADDVWHHQKIEICISVMQKKGLEFVYHLYEPEKVISKAYNLTNTPLKFKKRFLFALKNYIATPTVVMKKEVFAGFPLKINRCEDYCCWLDSIQNDKIYYVNLPLASGFKKPLGQSGLSSNILEMHEGFINSLLYLKKKRKISNKFFIISFCFENLKFPLRRIFYRN